MRAVHGRAPKFKPGSDSRIGLAIRPRPTVLPQACTLIGAAAMPEIDGDRQHTMRAVPIGACETAPDVGTGALCRRREELVVENSVAWLKAHPFPSSSDGQVCRASF